MKAFSIFIFTFLSFFGVKSQEWQTIPDTYFGCSCGITGAPQFEFTNKMFQINPYTNDLWMANGVGIMYIANNGAYDIHVSDSSSFPISTYGFLDFAFTPNAVYASRFWSGFYQYKNNLWSHILSNNYDISSIDADGDTIIITGHGSNYKKFFEINDSFQEFSFTNVLRTTAKNGKLWGTFDNVYPKRIVGNNGYTYSPDTCTLLSYWAYDIKFSKKTDSLYVAGDLGLSIAHGNTFIDSIDVNSSINMPANPSIIEFEFDHLDNIWALFGTDIDELNGIGYYNQANRTWEQFYDANNSPLDFTQKLTIEVDTSGNLWVAERDFLHVLKINNPPEWLATQKLEKESSLKIYPNPSANHFKIDVSKIKGNYEVRILDVFGQKVASFANQNEIEHNLDQGVYFVELKSEDGLIFSQKLMVLK